MPNTVPKTPILQLFAQWRTLQTHCNNPRLTDAEADIADAELLAVENSLIAAPTTCAADFAAKVLAYTSYGAFALTDSCAPEIWAEAYALTGISTEGAAI